MPGESPMDFLPVWGLFFATVILVLFSVEGGYRLGRFRRRITEHEKEAPLGGMVGAALGLLAFLLAFTFGLAATRFDARRQGLLDEANAIGTAYLRADLLPEHRAAVRVMLREYVDSRLEAVQKGKFTEARRRSEELQGKLWAHAVAVGEKHPHSIVVGLFIQSLNDVIDLHSKRVVIGLQSRIPGAIWAALYGIAFLSFAAMGYHAGMSGAERSVAILAVILAFSVVMWLIADLDRPQDGMLRVSQQALIDLRQTMADSKSQ